jgi:hypothetical protein
MYILNAWDDLARAKLKSAELAVFVNFVHSQLLCTCSGSQRKVTRKQFVHYHFFFPSNQKPKLFNVCIALSFVVLHHQSQHKTSPLADCVSWLFRPLAFDLGV